MQLARSAYAGVMIAFVTFSAATSCRAWPKRAKFSGRALRKAIGPGKRAGSGCRRAPRQSCSMNCGAIGPPAAHERLMTVPLYLDTSAVLRALLETGTSPQVEERIKNAT